MNRKKEFLKIKQEYNDYYQSFIKNCKYPLRDTAKGLWGTVSLDNVFEFFKRIRLQKYKTFMDLGSGDGCVVAIASLFTDAYGIEYDKELIDTSKKIFKKLNINTSRVKKGDYLKKDLSSYDIFFIFPDNSFSKGLEKKLHKDMKRNARLFIYNNIHTPLLMKKRKTYWFNQVPILTYKK